MQAKTQNIQRSALFSDFFGLELVWNINSVTSIIHNITINNKNIIKKTLNALQYTQSNLMFNKSLKNSYAITELQNRNDVSRQYIGGKQLYIHTDVFVNKFWKPALKKLNIDYRRPYNARHTYATNMLYNNLVTPVQLAQLLGHANTQMVYEVYVNYIDSFNVYFDRSINIYR